MAFDSDVDTFLQHCKSTIGDDEWRVRMEAARHFEENLPKSAMETQAYFVPTTNSADVTGWYLYQAMTYASDPRLSDMHFVARLIPKLKRIGVGLHVLLSIKGFNEKLVSMLNPTSKTIESTLNEILVALRYADSGFTKVEFVKEQQYETPDLVVAKRSKEMFVECKRLRKESDYEAAERKKWYRLSHELRKELKERKISQVFDIVFHKELQDYPDDYLYRKVRILIGTPVDGLQIDEKDVTVIVRPAKLGALERHLENNSIRFDSTMLYEILFDLRDPRKGITYVMSCTPHYMYKKYIDKIDWAFATIWYCDSPAAFDRKARSMKSHIAKAIKQIPNKGRGAIHLTVESYGGSDVELRILQKLHMDLAEVARSKPNMLALYLDLLRFSVPANENWEVVEDCFYFVRPKAPKWIVLAEPHLVTRPSQGQK